MLGGAGAAIYFAQDFSTSVSLMIVVLMENYFLFPDSQMVSDSAIPYFFFTPTSFVKLKMSEIVLKWQPIWKI